MCRCPGHKELEACFQKWLFFTSITIRLQGEKCKLWLSLLRAQTPFLIPPSLLSCQSIMSGSVLWHPSIPLCRSLSCWVMTSSCQGITHQCFYSNQVAVSPCWGWHHCTDQRWIIATTNIYTEINTMNERVCSSKEEETKMTFSFLNLWIISNSFTFFWSISFMDDLDSALMRVRALPVCSDAETTDGKHAEHQESGESRKNPLYFLHDI